MERRKSVIRLDGSTLKLIAAGAMVCSHVYRGFLSPSWAWVFLDVIGRISFPIFCFMLVEGFCHTRSRGKYLARLWIMAVLSEVPFDMLFFNCLITLRKQNVMFTMLIGVLTLQGMEWAGKKDRRLCMVPLAVGMAVAWLFKTDYSFWGVWVIGCFYMLRGMRQENVRLQACNMAFSACLYGWIQAWSLLSVPFCASYNGEKGQNLKYFFYIFYPAHLLILFLIRAY